jgi:hypothetical protein
MERRAKRFTDELSVGSPKKVIEYRTMGIGRKYEGKRLL